MALLKLAGAEPALQLAQLVALERLLGVTLPERIKEVRNPKANTLNPHRVCWRTSGSARGAYCLSRCLGASQEKPGAALQISCGEGGMASGQTALERAPFCVGRWQ